MKLFQQEIHVCVFHTNINIFELHGVMLIHFHCTLGVRIKSLQMTPFHLPAGNRPNIYGYTFTASRESEPTKF